MENLTKNRTTLAIVIVAVIGIGYLLFSGNEEGVTTQSEKIATTTEKAIDTVTSKPSTGSTPKANPAPAKTTPATTMTPDGLYIVNYTNAGFSPKALTIATGKGVRFINNSDKAMRIFADESSSPLYSSLNQSKTLGKGGVYDFIFTQSGNWAYHNLNNPTDKGTVLVLNK